LAAVKGQKITAVDYNNVVTDINKVFSDEYRNSAPPTSNQAKLNQEFGWGNQSVNNVDVGTKITAAVVNSLVDRVNLSAEHVGSEYELDRVISGQKITATLWNDIETVITDVTPNKNTAAIGQTTISELGSIARSTTFSNSLNFVSTLTFANYDQARYYFNSGSSFKLYLVKSSGDSVDAAWATAYERMGTVNIGLTNTLSTTANIISENKGFEHLTSESSLLLTLNQGGGDYGYGGYGYGDGGYGYGYGYGYGTGGSKTIKVYGKIVPTQGTSYQTGPVNLVITVSLNSLSAQATSGTHTLYLQSNKATTKTSGDITFSISNPQFNGITN
jgi:hypothetical protein